VPQPLPEQHDGMRARSLLAIPFVLAACTAPPPEPLPTVQDQVGRQADGRQVTPVNQTLTPHGKFVDLKGLRPQVIAQSRDGSRLYVAGKTPELLVIDAATGAILQRVTLPDEKQTTQPPDPNSKELRPDKEGQVSYTGLAVSPDGASIYLSNVRGSIKVFTAGTDGAATPSRSMPLPPAKAPRREAEIPSGLAVSRDGRKLYVCGNLSNQLLELDTATGAVLRTFAVGTAPFDVVLVGDRAFVSNQGGRRPEANDLTGPAGRGTTVRVDPLRHIASEGSVSVIDLAAGALVRETRTGLHASDLATAPDQRFVVCANAGSDTVSVLDVNGMLVDTLWARSKPSDLL
jgi:YVTN family beta-propeller protein